MTAVVVVLLPLLAVISIFLYVMDLPRKVGEIVSFDSAIRLVIFRISSPDEMRSFRDDVLHILESGIKDPGTDRWSLLHEMDDAKDEIEEKLRNGEFAFSFVGTITALLMGNVFGIVFGAVIITIVGLIFSFLVSARIIVTDVLCYERAVLNH
ncbi:hypothetical protein [Halorientalis regularis]|uniref:hypothetical protein n=1 Tax=Halorientalis regularis TaxID=660518 RepID=UPI001C312890|nr:hypothetical protein [Halorientalis regularis]